MTTATASLPVGTMPLGLNRAQAAEYAGVSVDLFDKLVEREVLPKPVKLGRRVVWDRRRITAAFDRLQKLSPSSPQAEDDTDDILEALEDG